MDKQMTQATGNTSGSDAGSERRTWRGAFEASLRTHLVKLAALLSLLPAMVLAQNIITIGGSGYPSYGGDGSLATAADISSPTGIVVDDAGNVYFSDSGNHRVRKITAGGAIFTVAGTFSPGFSGDGGQAASASLDTPAGLALDSAGNLYIADSGNHRIRKVATNGVITTVAGSGGPGFAGDAGPATSAQLDTPRGVAVDAAGNLYIADSENDRVRKVNIGGTISTIAGTGVPGLSGDGSSAIGAQISNPTIIVVSSSGIIVFVDQDNHRIRSVNGGVMQTLAGTAPGFGGDGGAAIAAAFNNPSGLALDEVNSALYITDSVNQRVRKIDFNANNTVSTIAGNGVPGFLGDGGPAVEAKLNFPAGVAVDADGNVYITDTINHLVRKVVSQRLSRIAGRGDNGDGISAINAHVGRVGDIAYDSLNNLYIAEPYTHRVRRVDNSGFILTYAGNGSDSFSGDGGQAVGAGLPYPEGLAFDASNNLYVVTQGDHRVRKITPGGITSTVAGTGTKGFSGDGGPATSAQLDSPSRVAVDAGGNLYISDTGNSRVRMVTPGGVISTVAGTGNQGFNGFNGTPTAIDLDTPTGLLATGGALYIADTGNNLVRKIFSGVMSTFAGDGNPGFFGDGGPATSAQLIQPSDIVQDGTDIYIIDSGNHRVRAVDSGGTITTIAGTNTATLGSFSGDGGLATNATFNGLVAGAVDGTGVFTVADSGNQRVRRVVVGGNVSTIAGGTDLIGDGGPAEDSNLFAPYGIVRDSSGNLLFTDRAGQRVRQINGGGIISTVAGSNTSGFGGDGSTAVGANFNAPTGISVDSAGNFYVADRENNRIRKINNGNGLIETVAGDGTAAFGGDNGLATAAQLKRPNHVAVDSAGNLYIADTNNHRIRMVTVGSNVITTVAGTGTPGFNGDGPATSTTLSQPFNIAINSAGVVYFVDLLNFRVRKIFGGNVVTVAGNGTEGSEGDGGLAINAQLSPHSIAFDSSDNLYISTASQCRVRMVRPNGVISTVAGNGECASSDVDNSPVAALGSNMREPFGLAYGGDKLYIAEIANSRLRSLDTLAAPSVPQSPVATAGGGAASVTFGMPYDDGGSTITGYTVISNPVGGIDTMAGNPDPTHEITGLANGTSYTFTVVATNAAGNSPVSAASSPVTPQVLARPRAYVGQRLNGTMDIFDTGTQSVIANVSTGADPTSIAVDPTGTRVYVTNQTSNNVSVINAETNTVISTVTAGFNAPVGIAIHPDNSKYYVGDFLNYRIVVLSTGSNTVLNTISLGIPTDPISNMAMSPDGSRLYVGTNNFSLLKVIDTTNDSVVAGIPLGGNGPWGIAIHPDGHRAYVALYSSDLLGVYDLDNNTLVTTIPVGDQPNGVAISPDGSHVYVANELGNTVTVIHTDTNTVTNTIATGGFGPSGIAFQPDGTRAYVTFANNGGVKIIDTSTETIIAQMGSGGGFVGLGNFIGEPPAKVPNAPTIGTVSVGGNQASVTFTPAYDGGNAVTGFVATSNPGGVAGSCSASPCVVSGLSNGTSYTFTVVATNEVGDSAASAASSSITTADIPGAPSSVTATAGNAQASVSFTAPGDGGSPITSYTVTSSPGGLTANCAGSPCVVTGLSNGTSYTFTVFATNGIGDGPLSAASNAVTPMTVPGAPTIGTATAGNGQASITFTAPGSNGGSAITGYTATSNPGGLTGSCANSPCAVTGLSNGTPYTFTVFATNAVGNSAASANSNSVTPQAALSVSTGSLTFAATAQGTRSASQTVTLTNLTGSAVSLSSVSISTAQFHDDAPSCGTSIPASGTCTIEIELRPGISDAPGAASANLTINTGDGAKVVSLSGTVAIYSSSTDVTGLSFPNTQVSSQSANQSATFTNNSSGTARVESVSIVGSNPGEFELQSENCSSGILAAAASCTVTLSFNPTSNGAKSASVRFNHVNRTATLVTLGGTGITATVPGAPTIGTATAGNGQVIVSFTPPGSDGGSPITGYTATSSPGGITGTCSNSPCVVTGLTNGTSYTFRVFATNAVGNSANSAASNPATPVTVPGAPTSVAATAGDRRAFVTFSAPSSNGGSAITGYTVTSSPGGGTDSAAGSLLTTRTILGLTPGTPYTFTVVATNAIGSGSPSAASNSVTPTAVATPIIVTTIGGNAPIGDGLPATSAHLEDPYSYAEDSAGNRYVADGIGNRVRKIAAGTGIITTFAGTGVGGFNGDGGAATSTMLNAPASLAIDAANNVYIADSGNHRVRKVTPGGIISTFAGNGSAGSAGDGGAATSAEVNSPWGLAFDGAGNLFIADAGNHKIRMVTSGGVISTVAGTGTGGFNGDGTATSSQLNSPAGIAFSGGSLYIADADNHRVRKLTGTALSTVAGNGTNAYAGDGGPATSANLNQPLDVAVDGGGNLYIADSLNATVRMVAPGGTISTFAGVFNTGSGFSGDGGPASSAQVNFASCVDAIGATLYICDNASHRIRAVTSGTISTVIGGDALLGDGGNATNANLYDISRLARDASGNLYLSDRGAQRIRKVAPNGVITTVAGTGESGFSGDTGPATAARLNFPSGIAVDASNNLYIADRFNQRVRKITAGGVISTLAGTGTFGYNGDGIAATTAQLRNPIGVTVDSSGNVYIAELSGNRVRKVTTGGIISTVAGTGTFGYNGDGIAASSAQLSAPLDVAVDAAGNLYIAENSGRVRKVDTGGTIHTFAGNGSTGSGAGDGGLAVNAVFNTTHSLAVHPDGRVFISDAFNCRVRVVDVGGAIETYAGSSCGFAGDNGPATSAQLRTTFGLAVDGNNLYVADIGNNRIRKVQPTTASVPGAPVSPTATAGNTSAVVAFGAPASDGGSPILGYTVLSNPAGGVDNNAGGTGLSHSITGLTNGVSYTFTVVATNAIGTGPTSAPSNAVTPATVPGAPTIGTATASSGQASITFTAPANNGGSAITGYTATSSPGGITGTCVGSPCVVTGLSNGTSYTFTVFATNGVGNGPVSAASNSVTPLGVPGAPTIGTATAGNGQATISFTAGSNGGSAITGFTATSSPGGITGTCSSSPCTVTGLSNGTSYTFTVFATNVVGNGPASASSNAVTPASVPGAPTIGTATAGNGQATISFTAGGNGGSAITGFTATSSPGGITGTCASSPCTVSGLSNGTSYTFTVFATNAVGNSANSAASNAVTPATVPSAPTIGTATAGNGTASITFTAGSNGGSAITGFTATSSPGGITGTCASSPCTVSGLSNGTSYTFTVFATNAVGNSASSGASNAVTPATVPAAPTIGTATAGNGTASITFTAGSNGGSAITGFTATSSPGGITGTCTSSPCTVTGLSNGTSYTFTVFATNAVGNSAVSAASNSVTPIAPVTPYAWVVNTFGNSVSVIDTNTGNVLSTIAVGSFPTNLALNPAGTRVYVTNSGNGTVSVLDTASFALVATIATGSNPFDVVVNPAGTRAYVTNSGAGTVSVIDTASNSVLASINVAAFQLTGITINPAGTRLFVSSESIDAVIVVDTGSNTVVTTIPAGTNPRGVAISPDGTRLYVPNQDSANVTVMDAVNSTVVTTVAVGNTPIAVAVNPAGTQAWIANYGSNSLSRISTASNTVLGTIAVGTNPMGLAFRTDGAYAYVSDNGDDNVKVIDAVNNTVFNVISVGDGPQGIEVAPTIVTAQPGLNITGNGAFGNITVTATSSVRVFTLRNPGLVPLSITSIANSNSTAFQDSTTPASAQWCGFGSDINGAPLSGAPVVLAPGATCTLNLVFKPVAAGTSLSASITITSNASTSPNAINVSGTGVAPAVSYAPGGGLNFGSVGVGTAATAQTGTFTNSSPITLSITGASFAVGSAGFSVVPGSQCLSIGTIGAGQSCTFSVSVTPTGVGSFADNVLINTSPANAGGNLQVSVTGVPVVTVPGAPTGATATAGNASATVSFTAPASNGGSAITGYTATSSLGGITGSCASSPCVVSGLNNGTSYTFTVVATNAVGNSSPSAASNAVTPTAPVNTLAYIANALANTVTVVDTASNTVITSIPVGTGPRGVAINPAGTRAYVVNFGSQNVSVINTATQSVIATVPVGISPYGVAVNPAGTRAYVTNNNTDNVSVIDTGTNTVIGSIAVGDLPRGVAFNPAGTRAYVANVDGDSVSVIDTGSSSVIATIAVGDGATGVAVNDAGTRLYVSNFGASTVSVIDTGSNTVLATIPVGINPHGIAVNPAGTRVYTVNLNDDDMTVIDTSTNTVMATVNLPASSGPFGVDVSPNGAIVYSTNFFTDNVTVVDASNNTVTAQIAMAGGAAATSFGQFVYGPTPSATTPGAPVSVTAVGGNAQATVSFTPPAQDGNSAITGYTATSSPGGLTGACASSPCVVTGLSNGTAYTFTVLATNAVGNSPASAPSNAVTPAAAATVPGVPTITSVIAGNGQVAINFTAPANGGSAITGYTATSSPSGITGTCTNSPCIVTGLANGTSYTFTLFATNAIGNGASSSPSAAVTPATVPGVPTITSVIAGNGQATISFTAPSNGGSAITSYTATSSPGGIVGTCTSSPCIVTGLANGTSYTFTLFATNAVGNGVSTPPSGAVTPATVPGVPTITSVVAGNGQAIISFTAPSNGGSPIAGYTATSSPSSITGTCTSSPCIVTGLANGTSYTFTVFATNAVGNGGSSSPSSAVTPATVPGVPTITSVVAGNGQATISFTAPANGGSAITGYTAASSPGGITGTCTSSPCVVSGLSNGTSYTFTVFASNAIGNGAASSPSGTVTPATVPVAPAITSVTAGNGVVTVAFTAPASNGGSAITGYTATSSPGGITGTCTSSPCVVSGLSNGTSYTFTVVATNAIGSSAPSAASNAVTPATVPSAPTGATAVAGNSQATVSFTAPASNGGSAITGYTVISLPAGGVDTNAGSTSTMHVISGLTNGVSYTFTVVATNAIGSSAPSAASNAVTPATVPGAPTGATATAGNAQATVSFTAPASNGGSAITGYTVISLPAGGVDTNAGSTSTMHVISGLTNGVSYTFTVVATNAIGSSAPSAASNAVTPSVPITVPGAPTGATATAGNAQATVSFTAPASNGGSAITGYTVTSLPAGGVDTNAGSTSTSHVITGLTNGVSYTFTVVATNAIGNSSPSAASNAVTPVTVPNAPTAVTAVAGNAEATVSFTPPTITGGSAITGYTVTSIPAGGVDTNAGSTGTSHVITGLVNGVSYTFTVRAINAQGSSFPSSPSNAVTPSTVQAPAAPTAVIAVAGNARASVSFSAPANDGGSPITGYTVTSSPAGGVDSGAGGLSLSRNITGLVNGTLYTFTVTATNSFGSSPPSAPSNGVIPSAVPSVSIADASVAEGNSGSTTMTFVVNLSQAAVGAVTFTAATNSSGTATAGVDYVAKTQALTIPAGQTSTTFAVTVNGDTTPESNETINVSLSGLVGAKITDSQGVGTILDDDGPLPTLSIADVSVNEGNSGTSTATFTASLSQVTAGNVTLTLATSDGTATAGSDYVARTQSVTIPAGQSSATFAVTINGDTDIEANETFNVTASAVTGATVADGQAVGTIRNDDAVVPVLSINDASVTEGNSGTRVMTFTASLSQATTASVGFTLATADGTASAGSDYVARTQAITIPAGQTSATFDVTVNGDTQVEASETFVVNATGLSGASAGDVQGTGTIFDDDAPLPTLSIADVTVLEGNVGFTAATFTISLSAPAGAQGVSFDIGTVDARSIGATALVGSDFISTQVVGQAIAAGQSSTTVNVKVVGDTRQEREELFRVRISNAIGATIADSTADGHILNDDGRSIGSIQGNGPMSPDVGQVVTTQGVVTALTRNGYFVQTPDRERDADATTSEAVFVSVAKPDAAIAIGDRVEVTGLVRESLRTQAVAFSRTEIVADEVTVQLHGQALPAPVVLDRGKLHPAIALDALERYEAMRVAMPAMTVVAASGGASDIATGLVHADGIFHGVAEGVARPFREPGLPMLEAAANDAPADLRRFDGNPERLRVDSLGLVGALPLAVDAGDRIRGLVGVLDDGAGAYTLLPDADARIAVESRAVPRAASDAKPGEAGIAWLGLRGLYDDRDDPARVEPVATTEAYALRLAKAANAICAYARAPAIIAVGEVESLATLSDLAAAVNDSACGSSHRYRGWLAEGDADDGLDIGYLVDVRDVRAGTPRVQVLSAQQQGRSAMRTRADGSRERLHDRVPLLLRARINEANGRHRDLSVMASQLQSVGEGNDADTRRDQRRAQAQQLAEWLQSRQQSQPREQLLLLGEFAASEFGDGRDDVLGLVQGRTVDRREAPRNVTSPVVRPLLNLMDTLPAAERYTRTENGDALATAHVLASQPLVDGASLRVEVVRLNADFGEDHAADAGVPMRVSDGDPVLLYVGPKE